ncbi:B-cell linker protein isoform 3-T3 [Anomaloglossus baeobatrachus]|uniref:B-cell linker protein isoform X2 n=1 Tax=Anomaloglossus baeobatrachus TaxID=238106 RepID=UPI003F5033EC
MAFKLPLREHFESWTTSQVADLFRQCGLQECTDVLEKLGLNGYSVLNMTDYELNKFNTLYKPQLQKLVSDIKKNEPRLINRIKKITKQAPPPTVPRRDYQTGPPGEEDDEWSDDCGSEYDSPDEHCDPTEDDGDNYEPPPNENHVSPPVKMMMGNNEYADNKQKPMNMRQPPKPHEPFAKHQQPLPSSRPNIANKPFTKPLPSPRQQPMSFQPPAFRKPMGMPQPEDEEETYIIPDSDSENYIEPTKDPPKKPFFPAPTVNRHNKPGPPPPVKPSAMRPAQTEDAGLYVVPENEPNPTPSPPTRRLPPKVFPPPNTTEDEYEVCEDCSPPEPPVKPKPLPSPRNIRPTPPTSIPQKPKPMLVLPQRDINSNTEKLPFMQGQRRQSGGTEPPPPGPPVPQKFPFAKPNIPVQRPPEVATRYIPPSPSRHGSLVEQNADVLNKEWYVASCDRQKAEEALTATSKDGSFLVRKSSGHDCKQPFTLVVFYKRRVYNIPVRYIEATRQYALGREKSGEEKFSTVAQIIENHGQTPLVLIDSQNNTKDSTRLKQAVRIP